MKSYARRREARGSSKGGRCRHPCHRWSQGTSGKIRGKTKKIEYDTFNNTGPHDAAQINKSENNIADYLQLNHGNDVAKAVWNLHQKWFYAPYYGA